LESIHAVYKLFESKVYKGNFFFLALLGIKEHIRRITI